MTVNTRTVSCLTVVAILFLALAGCKGRTHIAGTVRNKWGTPVYPLTITLRQGGHMKQVQASPEGKFDIVLEHAAFNVELKLTAENNFYKPAEKSFWSGDHLTNIDLVMEELPEPTLAEVRRLRLKGISFSRAKELAEQMCRQLPNASAFPLKSFMSGDDVHDTLVMLSGAAQQCLVDHLTDSTWMPDSRSEPLADFHAGDAALWILSDAGLNFDQAVMPLMDPKRWQGIGIFEYFDWVNRGNHRKLLQAAVSTWLQKHPDCCGSAADFSSTGEAGPSYRISPQRLLQLQQAWPRLRPGMDEHQARELLGAPDTEADVRKMDGVIALNRYERWATFYWIESSSPKPDLRRRNFLSDRYVIVFFSESGRFVRAFSNVPELPPVFPRSERLWSSMIEASMAVRN